MQEATIKVEYVNAPDKNPAFGSVKADGIYYSVPANMLGQFEQGKTYVVGFTTTEGRNGKTFYNLKELRSPVKPNGIAPSHNGRDDKMISALALYNHTCARYFATFEGDLDHMAMGDFLFQCRLAVDWAESKYKKFWTAKSAPPPAPKEAPPFDDEVGF